LKVPLNPNQSTNLIITAMTYTALGVGCTTLMHCRGQLRLPPSMG